MKNTRFLLLAISLLTASFVFAGGKPFPILDGTVKIKNDQSVPKKETIATLEYFPTSSIFRITGIVKIRDAEEAPHLEIEFIKPDGNKPPKIGLPLILNNNRKKSIAFEFNVSMSDDGERTLYVENLRFDPAGTAKAEFSSFLKNAQSITLKISVIMPGKGVVEISKLMVNSPDVSNKWFTAPTAGIIGGVLGGLWGLYGALIGCVGGILLPRGKGRKLLKGMLIFGLVMGVLQLLAGIAALCFHQPYHVWYPLVLAGLIIAIVSTCLFWSLKKILFSSSNLPPPS